MSGQIGPTELPPDQHEMRLALPHVAPTIAWSTATDPETIAVELCVVAIKGLGSPLERARIAEYLSNRFPTPGPSFR